MTSAATSRSPEPRVQMRKQTAGFAAFLAACCAVYWAPLGELVRLALADDTHSHILLVPFLTAGLIWMQREAIFRRAESSLPAAAACLAAGAALFFLRARLDPFPDGAGRLTLTILSAVLVAWAAFLLCYGAGTFRAALFPMLFLLLAVPIPVPVVDRLILWLQQGSSEVTYWLFRATDTPVLRRGFVFAVPGQTIEIAQECSGIRSSLAMLITCLMAGYLFLRTAWARLVLLLAAVPMLVIKNGIRIVTLTLLSIHVDPGFLHGKLHQRGGFAFFLLGLLILWPVLRWLQRAESKLQTPGRAVAAPGSTLAPRAG